MSPTPTRRPRSRSWWPLAVACVISVIALGIITLAPITTKHLLLYGFLWFVYPLVVFGVSYWDCFRAGFAWRWVFIPAIAAGAASMIFVGFFDVTSPLIAIIVGALGALAGHAFGRIHRENCSREQILKIA
ncbi:hypothetical protein [Corynebacterium aquilae]|uniref:Uncharacterized protein n=1 Tax=Corynebacterium aquilae DSM 44791 TaxID=1431546 RepID=A0A1L7CDT1_9CORY|nr:hypothetical protein [Corynebacterium aquilae]APT83974.1 hypothetical protein CAQU_01555 [Corynebacterium aquilae DSM 44791]